MVCESSVDWDAPPVEPPYFQRRSYRYGKTRLTLICREENAE